MFTRHPTAPIITPGDVPPSRPGWRVACVLNPGAFRAEDGRIGLLLRVAEAPAVDRDHVATAVVEDGAVREVIVRRDDPELTSDDVRAFTWRGTTYLTTLSHLRLAWSDDGERFAVEPEPFLFPREAYEAYGLEDARVVRFEDAWHLTYTQVSGLGVCVGHAVTRDWRRVERRGVLLPPHNKDVALFERRIAGRWYALHRPSGLGLGGHNIWLADSADGRDWGGHRCLLTTRPGMWDEQRVGAGAAPIETAAGWLELYHGADRHGRYGIGALLLDRERPWRVLARSDRPLIVPERDYERSGFYGECVFTNGHVVDGDTVAVYYGAADAVVCAGRLSVGAVIGSLVGVGN